MAPRNKRRTTVGAGSVPLSSCRALLVIDNEPIRRKALQDCRVALRQRDKVRLEWEHFEQKDRPAFDRWHNREFGKQLTRLRELGESIHESKLLIQAVRMQSLLRGLSIDEAYEQVIRAREAGPEGIEDEPEDADEDEDGGDWSDPFGGDENDDAQDGFEGSFDEFMRGMFGASEEEAREAYERLRSGGDQRGKEAGEVSARVKDVYRTLVRRLHPDMIDEADSGKQELWHAVQEAYRMRDLEGLESLLARCDMEEGVVSEGTPISQLRKGWKDIKKTIAAVRRQIRKARQDRAWGFFHKTAEARKELRSRIKRDLESNLRGQVSMNDELKDQIGYLEKRRQDRLDALARREAAAAERAKRKAGSGSPGKGRARSSGEDKFQGKFAF